MELPPPATLNAWFPSVEEANKTLKQDVSQIPHTLMTHNPEPPTSIEMSTLGLQSHGFDIDPAASFTHTNPERGIQTDAPKIPEVGKTSSSSLGMAAGINALGNVGGSVIGGIANLGSSLIQRGTDLAYQGRAQQFEQKQIDRAYDSAHAMGLVSPLQMQTDGTMGNLLGNTFTTMPRTPFNSVYR